MINDLFPWNQLWNGTGADAADPGADHEVLLCACDR